MRVSDFPIFTLKDNPSDAEIVSHKLMIRAGLIRKISSGQYSWLPVGMRVLEKIQQIIRSELNNTKANYWLMCIELENYKDRNSFLKYTNNNGIMTRPIWRLMTSLSMYKQCQRDSQKNALFLEERIVNIPSSVSKYLFKYVCNICIYIFFRSSNPK